MSEERRAVIEAALRHTASCQNWAEIAETVERAVAEWERSREPTDAEIKRQEDRAEHAEFLYAQEREFSIDTNRALTVAVGLLKEWDERETALARVMCVGGEPVVEPGSFVDRLRRCVADPVRFAQHTQSGDSDRDVREMTE